MYAALLARDATYDGVFFVAVKTTDIFCRPICAAKKPKRENVDFYPTARDALFAGFRPCKRCRPLEPPGGTPDWLAPALLSVELDPERRLHDADLRGLGIEPSRARRWFQSNHGMTFHAYVRARRLGRAFQSLREGKNLDTVVFEHGYESHSGFRSAFGKTFGRAPAGARREDLIVSQLLESPLGPLVVGATRDGVCLLEFSDRRMLERQLRTLERRVGACVVPGTNAPLEQMVSELSAYFVGRRQHFTVPLVTPGSDFQQSVWRALRRIPYGETRSYAQVAREIGQPSAVRAVARANGDNRIAIVIPCHRVIGSNGTLTGYGGGLWRKKRLLELEQGRDHDESVVDRK